jgi:hypothetical protein
MTTDTITATTITDTITTIMPAIRTLMAPRNKTARCLPQIAAGDGEPRIRKPMQSGGCK